LRLGIFLALILSIGAAGVFGLRGSVVAEHCDDLEGAELTECLETEDEVHEAEEPTIPEECEGLEDAALEECLDAIGDEDGDDNGAANGDNGDDNGETAGVTVFGGSDPDPSNFRTVGGPVQMPSLPPAAPVTVPSQAAPPAVQETATQQLPSALPATGSGPATSGNGLVSAPLLALVLLGLGGTVALATRRV
jgi:hypothetical protein